MLICGVHTCRPSGPDFTTFTFESAAHDDESVDLDSLEAAGAADGQPASMRNAPRPYAESVVPLQEWERDELGIVNAPGTSFMLSEGLNCVPTLRVWEGLTVVLVAVGGSFVIYVHFAGADQDDRLWDWASYAEVLATALSLCRFDPRRLLWTAFIMAIFVGIFTAIGIFSFGHVPDATTNDVVTALIVALATAWLFRLAIVLYYMQDLRAQAREAEARQTEKLKGRNFQTGDVLLSGSAMEPVALLSEMSTMSVWGHVAIVVRGPSLRVRTAFALARRLESVALRQSTFRRFFLKKNSQEIS